MRMRQWLRTIGANIHAMRDYAFEQACRYRHLNLAQ